MSDKTPTSRLSEILEAYRSRAKALSGRATHETMKAEVRLAERDLDEAAHRLKTNLDNRPYMLAIVNTALGLADARLKAVEWGLDKFGDGAELIG